MSKSPVFAVVVRILLLIVCTAGSVLMPPSAWSAEPVKIGVLAFRPKAQIIEQWTPLTTALRQAMPDRDFVVEALTFPEMEQAVASRQLDFVLTNPGYYVLLARRNGVSAPLATLAMETNGQSSSVFGGVIFTRAKQTQGNTLSDLKGKTIAAVSMDSLGGYQVQAHELKQAGIALPQDAKIITTGMPHDAVIDAVLAGRAEFGFVRTSVLEMMAHEGKLDMKQIRVINSQNLRDFPAQASTRLYPEWPFVPLSHIDEDLARRVAAALFLLQEDSALTRQMGIRGFSVPADYTPVSDLLRDLRMPPFDAAPTFTLHDVWIRYWWQTVAALIALALILLLSFRLLFANRKLAVEKQIVLQQRQKLHENETRLQATLDAIPDLLFEIGLDGRYHACHSPQHDLLVAPPEDLIGKRVSDVMPPEAAAIVLSALQEANQNGHSSGKQIVLDVPQSKMWFELSLARKALLPGEDQRFTLLSRNITRRKHYEEKLQLAASVFTHAREGILITDANARIIDINEAFSRITGYGRDEIIGQNPRILNSGRQEKAFYNALWRDLSENGYWYGEVWNRRKNGEVYAEMQTISAVCDADGKPQHYVSLFSDITPLKEHQSQLEHIAHYDALTGLPNRVLLADRLQQAMVQAQRRNRPLTVAYLDLDGFKSINDKHGHDIGDQLLIALAGRMKQALREGDTLARLGGDEFVAVLLDLADATASVPILNRLLAAAAEQTPVGDLLLQVSASVGVTFYPQTEADTNTDQLFRQSDQAMYQAKLAGKNRYHFFDAEQDSSARSHHESLDHIRRALAQSEFVLHYQPKVNMRTGALIGAEALIRWQHPEKGLLPPAAFLPVIEHHPLAIEVGEWVIDTALSQIERWSATGREIPVSVNVGAQQLQQPNFAARLHEMLAMHPTVKPSCFELEVLETSALEDLGGASQVIEDCRALGVSFALDDFGTGYSSLSYLKHLPVTLLKIDQSFVRNMLDNPDDLAILEGVVGLASAFRRQVIAEGVETVAHGEMLLQLGCEQAQGYGIARPMPAADLPGWIASWQPDAAWSGLSAVSRDDLPLLFASVEHRAYIVAFAAFLRGERETSPVLDHHQCHFGIWLDGEARRRYGTQAVFEAIEHIHRQVHILAAELSVLKIAGRQKESLARLDELHTLRDTLLAHLKQLAQG